MRSYPRIQRIIRPLIANRILLAFGLSAACGLVLNSLFPIHDADPLLRLIAMERPCIYLGIVRSYGFFLYSTPFLFFSMGFSLLYVHLGPRREAWEAPCIEPIPKCDDHDRRDREDGQD